MDCVCGAHIPADSLRDLVDAVLRRGGDLETLEVELCPKCGADEDEFEFSFYDDAPDPHRAQQ